MRVIVSVCSKNVSNETVLTDGGISSSQILGVETVDWTFLDWSPTRLRLMLLSFFKLRNGATAQRERKRERVIHNASNTT